MVKFIRKLSFVLFIFMLPSVWAWGPIGHHTIGLIAEANLTPKARASIKYLLQKRSLAEVSNWADYLKFGAQYSQTHAYHYEKIPTGKTYLDSLKEKSIKEKQKGGLIEAILVARDVLRGMEYSLAEKADALKFVIHFIGDLHQPLHTGRPEDRGGNDLSVFWYGLPLSLHSVWDLGMIYTGHIDILDPLMGLQKSSLIYANYLAKLYNRSPLFFEAAKSDIEKWVYEAVKIRESGVYNPMYKSNQHEYQKKLLPVLDFQIWISGLRLAHFLNQIFESAPIPQAEITFRRQIEKIVGDLCRIIKLTP